MSPVAGAKILRIALIQGSKITEDRSLRKRANVTVGTDPKNSFVVPVSNLPASFTLFEFVNNQYALVFTEQMSGKVKVSDSDLSFEALRSQGLAKKRGTVYVLPLNDAMKGRVTLGEVSVLFQFVAPPPEPPKPELPAAVKGSWWQAIDQLFFTILAVSLFVHFSGAGFIACQPMPEERELSLDELPDRFAKVMMPKAEPPRPKEEQGSEAKEEVKEAKKETKKSAEDAAASKAAMQKAVSSKGLLKILGSAGGAGAFEDVLGGDTGAGSIADALQGAGGVGVATADAVAGGPKGGGTGQAAGIGDLGTSGAGAVDLGKKGDAVVRGRVADAAPEVDSSDVDREALARYVKARKSAIQACYEKELKRNPTLKGKVVVRFTISTAGRASEVDIEENTLGNDAVASCIRAVIRAWVFPFKPPSEVPVAYPFVFAPAS